jgi:signal transduction histidine kinase
LGAPVKRSIRTSIVARISIVFGLVVLCTSLIVYVGGDMRAARLYRSQRVRRVAFLAESMSYGIRNLLASSGSKERVSSFIEDVLGKAMLTDASIQGCEVRDRKGTVVYGFEKAVLTGAPNQKSLSVAVKSGKTRIGTITIYYDPPTVYENEKTQQMVMLGNTVSAMIGYYLKRLDLFQVKFLAQKIIEENPDVLYASISGPFGNSFYQYKTDIFGKYMTVDVKRRAMSVSVVQPIVLQEIGYSKRYGQMVEVAVPVEIGGRILGIVRIGYSTASLTKALARERMVLGLIIAGLVSFALGLALLMSRNITRPLVALTRLARGFRMEDGAGSTGIENAEAEIKKLRESFDRLDEKIAVRGDEVGGLATAFQGMIRSLETRIVELKYFYHKMSVTERFYAMGQLSAGIAHEINNPLTIISTYVQLMLKRSDLDPELRSEVGTIKEEIDRISEKVKDLLSFAQEAKFEYADADVHTFIRKSLDLTRYKFKKQGIELTTEFASEDPLEIRMDAGKMRQVFLNLIFNASQAMAETPEKRLVVGTRVDEGKNQVEIFFTDTGCGIPTEHIGRIFDPFFTTKQAGVGTGLGLSISYNIVAAHGGDILVELGQERGTTFRIILPRG